MNESAFVSVIIPTYNSSETVLKTLESVRNQTYFNYEIIVIDDGSTDATVELLRPMKDIKLIEQTNQGVSAARNRGVEAANGEYIAFLDSDDLWHPQKLEIQLEIAKSLKNIGIVATSFKKIYEVPDDIQFPVAETPRVESIEEINFYRFLETIGCLTSSVLMPKEVFLEVGGFDREYRSGEDRDLWLKVAYKYSVYLIPLDLVCYYIRGAGLTESIKVIGEINTIFITEKWNPQKTNTGDALRKIDNELYKKKFKKNVIRVGKLILRNRTTVGFKNESFNHYQIYNIYWQRFGYIFGKNNFFIKFKMVLKHIIKDSRRMRSTQRIDEGLLTKLINTKFHE